MRCLIAGPKFSIETSGWKTGTGLEPTMPLKIASSVTWLA